MPIESTPLRLPWTLTANLMFMETFNDSGRGAVLGFSGLCCLDDFNNNATQNMGRLSTFGAMASAAQDCGFVRP